MRLKGTPGNTEVGSISVPLTSCLTGLDYSVLQIKTKIVNCHTANSKPVKQEVNGTVMLPPLVFPGYTFLLDVYFVGYFIFSLPMQVAIFEPLILGLRVKYYTTVPAGHKHS